jgi:hypothetical protein
MVKLKLDGKEYELRLGYKQMKELERLNPGQGFEKTISSIFGSGLSFGNMEKFVYLCFKDPDFTEAEFEDKLDASFESEELTFEEYTNTLTELVEESVFMKTMMERGSKAQTEAERKKGALQAVKN